MKRRILAMIMTLAMLLSLFPVTLATETAGETGQLTHRGLDGDGESWWIGDEFLHQGIGQVPPGSEHWLAFYAGETEQAVEVQVTQGDEYVQTLEKLPDGSNYYYIKIARDCWGQEITLASTDGAWTDTFSIGRDHAAFFADADPDLENYSDYLYDFTLTQENTSLYLHIEEPEGFVLNGIQTYWYDQETGDEGPHSGWDPAWYDDLGDGLYQINFDPIYAAQCYGEDDFDLFLEVLYQDGEYEHAWGTSIRILNDVNVLTHKGLDGDGENWWPRDEDLNWGIGQVAPGSEHWLVFYTGYNEEAVEVKATQGGEYVTLERIGDQEEPYYYIKVNEGCWGETVTLSATVDGESWTDTFVLDRNHADFFSEPGSDLSNYLNYFQLSDTNTTLYLHIDPPEWADSYDIRTEWYDENTNESGLLEGCDVVEIQPVDGQEDVFAITFDTQAVTRNYGHDDFGLNLDICYQEVMDDGETREEIWGTGIHIANQLPFLHYLWLEEEGEGWFVRDENNWSYDFSIRPGDTFFHTYFLTYFENGEPVTTPVIPTPQDGRLIVKKLEEEFIKAGEAYGDYFVKVFSEEDKWDEEVALSAEVDGHTASITVPICRGQAEFYETTVPGNDTVLMEVDKEKNPVFYLGFQREDNWHVEEVYVTDDSLATLEDLGTDASGKYFLFQVTLTEKGIRIAEDFHLDVEYQWVNDEDENDRHYNGCGIYVPAIWPEEFKATFKIDSHDVEYYAINDQGGTHAYVWEHVEAVEGEGDWYPVLTPLAEDFPIHYNYLTNTITLTLEETGDILECLELIYEDHEGNQLLPNQNVNLSVEGENIIWNGSHEAVDNPDRVNYGPALRLEGGINLTITGEEGSSLVVHSENDDYDPWTHAAIDMWNNHGGSLTIADQTQVTVTVGGEGWEVDGENTNFNDETGEWETTYIYEDGQKVPANFHAIGVEDGSGVSLFVQDNAELSVLPGEGQARWHGLEGLQNLEVVDNAILNSGRIIMAENEDAKLRVRGDAQLNVTMTTNDEGDERYYLGIAVPTGSFALCDNGTINITAPQMNVTTGQVWAEGLVMEGGSFEVRSGNLNLDLTGIQTENLDLAGAIGLSLGNSESDRVLTAAQNNGSITIQSGYGTTALQVAANTTANLNGGTIDIQAWQGIVNNGILNLRDSAKVNLEPWTLNGEIQRTWDNGLFYNDVHYIMRQVSALNVYGGELNVHSFANPALVSATEFIQTGGTVTLTDRYEDQETNPEELPPLAWMGGRNTLSGGKMILSGVNGLVIYPEQAMLQNYFRLTGTELTILCEYNGVIVSSDTDRIATMNLMGGKLTVNQGETGARIEGSAVVLDGGGLTVTGGQHIINGNTALAEGQSIGLRAYQSPGVKINGGTLTVSGNRAVVAESADGNPIVCGSGMYVYSNNDQASKLEYVESDPQAEDEIFQGLTRYTLRETVNGQQVDAASVTFEAGEAPVVPTTAQIEVTTGRATVGAMVTMQANVTAENGTAAFTLPQGMQLIEGSITVNNVAYAGDLSAIPVKGSAHIVFRVEPAEEGTFAIGCKVTDGNGASAEAETEVTVYGFRVHAPSHTRSSQIIVQGSAVPDETIALTVVNNTTKQTAQYTAKVTALGTFAISVELPMVDEELSQVRTFTVSLDRDGVDPLTVIYTPNLPYVNDMSMGNQNMDENDYPVWFYNHIVFRDGKGVPDRNFYTYIPDMDLFEFDVFFVVPEGWEMKEVVLWITYLENGSMKTMELTLVYDGEVDREGENLQRWTYTANLPAPLTEFWLVYQTIGPNGEEEEVTVPPIVISPIIDPSGTIYAGALDNPVAGAEVTLYYGGDGEEAGEAVVFDMAPYGQVNPQITDASGHYAWDVPPGWWQVVAEKNGVTTKSDWVHVLPAHTDLHLNLNLPITFDLLSIQPDTDDGKIPAGNFQAEVKLKNNGAKADVLLMVATYGENGQFLSFQPKPITGLKTGRTTTVQIDVDNPDGKAKSMKAFLVKDFTTTIPLSAAVEFPTK